MVLTLGQTTNSLMFLQIPCFFTVVPVLCISVSGAGGTYCRLSWICFFVLSVFRFFGFSVFRFFGFSVFRFFLTSYSVLFSSSG